MVRDVRYSAAVLVRACELNFGFSCGCRQVAVLDKSAAGERGEELRRVPSQEAGCGETPGLGEESGCGGGRGSGIQACQSDTSGEQDFFHLIIDFTADGFLIVIGPIIFWPSMLLA